jgi:hypothetical protein
MGNSFQDSEKWDKPFIEVYHKAEDFQPESGTLEEQMKK